MTYGEAEHMKDWDEQTCTCPECGKRTTYCEPRGFQWPPGLLHPCCYEHYDLMMLRKELMSVTLL